VAGRQALRRHAAVSSWCTVSGPGSARTSGAAAGSTAQPSRVSGQASRSALYAGRVWMTSPIELSRTISALRGGALNLSP
jgi:hypothetical protein